MQQTAAARDRAETETATAPEPVHASRVEIRNRLWRGIHTVAVLQGLDDTAGVSGLRAALRRLHAADPGAHAVCRIEGRPLRWMQVRTGDLEGWLEELIVDGRGRLPEDAGALAQWGLQEARDDRPFTVTVGDGFQVWQVNHMLADGSYAIRNLLRGLTMAAARGEIPVQLMTRTGAVAQHPLMSATWHSLARRPRVDTWRTALSRLSDLRHSERCCAAPTTRQELGAVVRRGEVGSVAALREWGAVPFPGVSVAVLIMAAARISLERHGLVGPTTDSVVMYDLRRYLPRGNPVDGNLSGALRLADPRCRDPYRLAEQIQQDADLALPLISLLAAAGAEAVAPVLAGVPWPGSARRRPGPVVLTHLGPLLPLRRLPWSPAADECRVVTAAAPSVPDGITVTTSEWAGATNATITFDSCRVPREQVARAATALVEAPWSLLEEAVARESAVPGPARG